MLLLMLFLLFSITVANSIELEPSERFIAPNPYSIVPPTWINMYNIIDIIKITNSGDIIFVDRSTQLPVLYQPQDKRLITFGEKKIGDPKSFGAIKTVSTEGANLWFCDSKFHRVSCWAIEGDTVVYSNSMILPDPKTIPVKAYLYQNFLILSCLKVTETKDGFELIGLQVYDYSTGKLLHEGAKIDSKTYREVFSEEGLSLINHTRFDFCFFNSGILSVCSIFPEVVYYSLDLNTIATFNISPPSYVKPIKYSGSFETPVEEDYKWISKWTTNGHVMMLDDSIAVTCYELGGMSEIAFFIPATGKLLGYSDPLLGCLIDSDGQGKLYFVEEEISKEAIQIATYKVDFE